MFTVHPERPRLLLVGEGAGTAAIVAFAKALVDASEQSQMPLVLLGLSEASGFRPRPSTIMVPGMPAGVIACMPALDDIGIPSRLANPASHAGCFEGDAIELATAWLETLDGVARDELEMLVCAPSPELERAGALAERYGVARQLAVAPDR